MNKPAAIDPQSATRHEYRPLDGRVAVITGGLNGIGRAITHRLALAGATVAVLDIAASDGSTEVASLTLEVNEMGARLVIEQVDITDNVALLASLARVSRDLGDPDILISNAGLIANFGTLETLPDEAWARELAVNLTGAFQVARAAVPAMAAKGWGRVIFLSSCAAWTGSPVQVGYAPTKAGLVGLSHTIARSYGPKGVTANAILPGFVSTDLVNAHFPAEERQRVEAAVPIRRFVTPDEVAELVLFLASPQAAAMNGTAIPIDGGMALSAGNIDG
jgi:NAD(P)-dependent dehydrogenase (short-subunit alcohol dehydrogenase family)